MNGYLVTNQKNECFGCGACNKICPVSAIQMEEDHEGFLYPKVDQDKCISCGQCHKVCPAENLIPTEYPRKSLVGYSTQTGVRNKSASGGAFHALVDCASDGTVIFGVEWQNRSRAVYAKASRNDAYKRFSKSKYVQSVVGDAYIEAKELLDAGRDVLFVGTPCQIAGLRRFLKRDYINLLCVDLVCHGVPSSKTLEQYLQSMDRGSCKVTGIDFREKVTKRNGTADSKCAVLHYSDGTNKAVDYESSGFLRGFACGLFFRPSCATCPFACASRVSDLTIGDAWGIEKEKPKLNPHEGVSLILVNTEKGEAAAEQMKCAMMLEEVSTETMVSGNGRLKSPDRGHQKRCEFFQRFESEDFEKLIQEFIPRISLVRRAGHAIKRLIRG